MKIALLPSKVRPVVEGRLPASIEPIWWSTPEELEAEAHRARIGWFDLLDKPPVMRALQAAKDLEWLHTGFTGVDWLPLDDLRRRDVVLSNGSGVTADAVAEFAVLGMLAIARNYREIVRAQDRREWLNEAPGDRELAGSRAIVFGAGAIGSRIERILQGFGIGVDVVRSKAGEGHLGPEDWRGVIGEYDWVVLALPGTSDTAGLLDRDAIGALKGDAVLINVARADVVDQDALVEALEQRRIAGAMLDLADPEPLPPGHRLWQLDNVHLTMHLAGIPTPASRTRAAERFVANCERFVAGEALEAEVDLSRGY